MFHSYNTDAIFSYDLLVLRVPFVLVTFCVTLSFGAAVSIWFYLLSISFSFAKGEPGFALSQAFLAKARMGLTVFSSSRYKDEKKR